MHRCFYAALGAAVMTSAVSAAQPSADEKAVWSLEQSYWRYVKANDLPGYRTLWHPSFLGWPLSSPEPVGKEHITEWIAAHSAAGEALKSYDLQPLAQRAVADTVTVTYRIRMTWTDAHGVDKPSGLRIIHTWLRSDSTAGHGWQIISGMAAPPNADGR